MLRCTFPLPTLLLAALIVGVVAARPQSAVEDADSEAAAAPAPPTQEILVRFRAGATAAGREAAVRRAAPGLKSMRLLRQPAVQLRGAPADSVFRNLVVVDCADAVEARRAMAQLAARSDVVYAEPNSRVRLFDAAARRVPNDFEFGAQWGLLNSGQGQGVAGNDVHATEAWQVASRASQVRVAVVDTGVDYYHPDLEANVWTNSDEIPGNGIDDDHNGYIDDVHGYDFVSDDGDPMDDHSHGSHVAGIIGAVGDNRIGVAGLCWETRLMAVKAFDEHGQGTIESVVQALQYAAANGARIINASWGQTDKSRTLQDAVTEIWDAGILIVAAAGNERTDVAPYPAAFDPVLAVAALNSKAQRASFSNYGAFVDVAAPGEAILSTTPNARYDFLSGTSMATPHATGVAALVLALHPDFTPTQIADVLRNSVDELQTDQYVGTGRLNAFKAVSVVSPLPTARLRAPKVLAGRLDLTGTASGTSFAGYRLEFGTGTYPTNWAPLHTGSSPVIDGVLLADFNSSVLGEGVCSIRLIVTDAAGQEAQDRAVVTVRNVEITAPMNNDVIRAGEVVTIRGTAFGTGRTYTLEHGVGVYPTQWSTAGIELRDGGAGEPFAAELGTWDTGFAQTNDFHTLRLTARAGGVVVGEWYSRLLYLDGRLRPGWPVHLPSTGLYPTNDWRHVTVADLDGDGRQEILRVTPGSPPGAPAQLLVFGADGTVRWTQQLDAGEPSADIPVVGDVDGDGRLEVFVDAGEKQRLFAFHHDGTPLGGAYPMVLPTASPGKVLADLDRDGHLELICLGNTWGSSETREGRLAVYDAATARLRASWRVELCWGTAGWPRRFPAVGNFDRDRDLEIVAPVGCGEVAMFDLTNPERPAWTRSLAGEILAAPVVADFDGDGYDDILVACNDPAAVDGRGMAGGLYLLTGAGAVQHGWPVMVESSFATAPAVADCDGDGRPEIAVVDAGLRQLHLLRGDGFNMPGWPVFLPSIPVLRSAPVIGDLDGDARPEILLAVPGQLPQVMFSGGLANAGGLNAWHADGARLDLHAREEYAAVFLESASGASRLKSPQVTLTDLDSNGRLDIVTCSIDDFGYSPKAPVSTRKERYTLYAWELGVPFNPEASAWPMFQRDVQRSGYLPSPGATNHPPRILNLPRQTIRQGGAFFPIALDHYVEDADHDVTQLQWQVTGHSQLRVSISDRRVLTVATPDADWTGVETLRFVVRDPEGASDEVAVEYAVQRDYLPPAAGDDFVAGREDEPVDIAVLANDSHPLGLPLQVEQASRPSHGRVSMRPEGVLRYSPSPNFNGTDTFTYMVIDGQGGMALATVEVNVAAVPDAPVAGEDRATIDEDTALELDVLANDSDPDNEPVRLLAFTRPTTGRAELLAGGVLRYTPAPDWSGNDGFEYTLADPGGQVSTGTVQIAVRPVNDPPVTHDQSIVLNRNLSADVFYDASDPEDAQLSFEILEAPKHGDLWKYPSIATYYPEKGFAGTDTLAYIANDGGLTSRVTTVTFQVLDVNNPPKTEPMHVATRVNRPLTFALAATDADEDPVTFDLVQLPLHGTLAPAGTNFLYTPERDFLGDDRFTFRASDGRDSSPETAVAVTVTDKNTAPTAKDATVQVKLNTPTEIVLQGLDGEGDPLVFNIVTNPAAGQLTGQAPLLRYTPDPDYSGPDRFSFRVSDGELESEAATITLQVTPKNRLPVARDQSMAALVGQATPVLFDLADPDGDALRVAILKGPQLGRISGTGTNFVYVPRPGAVGFDVFTYKAWDGHIYSEVRTVTIQVSEPPPPTPPRFESIEPLGDSLVRLRLKVDPAANVEIQNSTNLVDWQPLRTVEPAGPGIELVHTNTAAGPAGFYRALRR